MAAVIAVAGSRSLPSSCAPLVSAVVVALARRGRLVCVSCCPGADRFALAAALSVRCLAAVFAAAGPSPAVGSHASFPPLALPSWALPLVRWWAGGAASVPLRARLVRRAAASVRFAAASGPGAGLVCFLRSPHSRGSVLALRLAARLGLPAVVFCCGFLPAALPSLGSGAWVPAARSGVFAAAVRWAPPSLFP
jgi:hypothetical protein